MLEAFDLNTGDKSGIWRSPEGSVESLALGHETLLVAGDFDEIDGVARHDYATIDHATGKLTDSNAGTSTVNGSDFNSGTGIVQAGGVTYVSGDFTEIQQEPRPGIAALDATTARLLPWRSTINATSSLGLIAAHDSL